MNGIKMNWYQLTIREVFERLQSSENGLVESDAKERLMKYGFNKLRKNKNKKN